MVVLVVVLLLIELFFLDLKLGFVVLKVVFVGGIVIVCVFVVDGVEFVLGVLNGVFLELVGLFVSVNVGFLLLDFVLLR